MSTYYYGAYTFIIKIDPIIGTKCTQLFGHTLPPYIGFYYKLYTNNIVKS